MIRPLARALFAGALAMFLAAAPALADPAMTGGLRAVTPPVVSPQGGVSDPGASPPAVASQTGGETPDGEAPTTTSPTTTTPERPTNEGDSTIDVPLADDPSPTTPTSSPAAAPASGGGLPHTGFALAALIAVGTGFFLTGYALRYSRALDG